MTDVRLFEYEALTECPLCASEVMIPAGRIDWQGYPFWYVACPSCGLKYMNPRPTAESYRRFYRDNFWQQKLRGESFKAAGQIWNAERLSRERLGIIEDYSIENIGKAQRFKRLPDILSAIEGRCELSSQSRLLEIGCGFGENLTALHERFQAATFAIEPSAAARAHIEAGGIIKLVGSDDRDIRKLCEARERFDLVIMSHVLENTVDPIGVLSDVAMVVNGGGLIYVQTPNLPIFDQMNPYHPFIFSRASLRRVAERCGLAIEFVSDPKYRMLTAICRVKT